MLSWTLPLANTAATSRQPQLIVLHACGRYDQSITKAGRELARECYDYMSEFFQRLRLEIAGSL